MDADVSQFPIVWLPAGAHCKPRVKDYLLQLQLRQPFILLSDQWPLVAGDAVRGWWPPPRERAAFGPHSDAGALQHLVMAYIQVAAGSQRAVATALAPAFQRFWDFPLFVVPSRTMANIMARTILCWRAV